MGDGRVKTAEKDATNNDQSSMRLAESLLLDSTKKTGGGPVRFDDPSQHLDNAQMLVEELDSFRGKKPYQTIKVPDGKGGSIETTVARRLEELPKLIDQEFKASISGADAKDPIKLVNMLTDVDQRIQLRMGEMNNLKQRGDLFANFKNPKKVELKALDDQRDPMDNLTLSELLVLKSRLAGLVSAPADARLQYASVLSDRGDLTEAQRLLGESLLKGGAGPIYTHLAESLSDRIRRNELSNGHDPLELARIATGMLYQGNLQAAERKFDEAQSYSSAINQDQLKTKIAGIEKELTVKDLPADKQAQLLQDKLCLEELVHADAAVSFSRVGLAAAQGRFGDVQSLLERAAAEDPEFTADKYDEYLNMMTFAKSAGQDSSVAVFHNHLVDFQRHLGPQNFDLEAAKSELDKAQAAAQAMPFDDIKKFSALQEHKLAELKKKLENKDLIPFEKTDLESKVKETETSLRGLKLLAQAPQYVKLMSGVFELANKHSDKALEIFDQIERESPEYAKQNAEQLNQLREFAKLPATKKAEESWIKSVLKELVCTTAAIAAGALVVVATGWSGPAALAAGAGAGALVRSGMKGLMGDEVRWYDPVIGAVDGLSGGAGALIYRSAFNGLSATTRTLTATERALSATGAESAALEGLTGSARALSAQRLAAEGAAEIGSQLPWGTRIATRLIPFAGNPAYREALAAAGRLSTVNLTNRFMANMAGATATSLLSRAGHGGLDAMNGRYKDFSEFSNQYITDVGADGLFGAFGGTLLPFKGNYAPVLYPGRRVAFEIPEALPRLEEINKVLAELDAPSNPQQIRQWYLMTPGPKVNIEAYKRPAGR